MSLLADPVVTVLSRAHGVVMVLGSGIQRDYTDSYFYLKFIMCGSYKCTKRKKNANLVLIVLKSYVACLVKIDRFANVVLYEAKENNGFLLKHNFYPFD